MVLREGARRRRRRRPRRSGCALLVESVRWFQRRRLLTKSEPRRARYYTAGLSTNKRKYDSRQRQSVLPVCLCAAYGTAGRRLSHGRALHRGRSRYHLGTHVAAPSKAGRRRHCWASHLVGRRRHCWASHLVSNAVLITTLCRAKCSLSFVAGWVHTGRCSP